jgi:hypothetical protein
MSGGEPDNPAAGIHQAERGYWLAGILPSRVFDPYFG